MLKATKVRLYLMSDQCQSLACQFGAVRWASNCALYWPKVGPVRAVLHRAFVGQVKTVTVPRTPTGTYDASILCDDGQDPPGSVRVMAGGSGHGAGYGTVAI